MLNRSGEWIKNLSGDLSYKSFRPSPLPPDPALNIDSDVVKNLVEANRNLAQLDTAAKLIPNAELFISMYVRKEALISSQIEGTQCTLDDVLDPQIDSNTNLDVGDVINYVKACTYAIKRLDKLPLCNRLLREIHRELLQGVRGKEKNPGEFRRSQNWIGAANCTLKEARYIPPNVEDMQSALADLERYMNEGDDYDPLIRIALIHYQFETIHPFLDGNGRVGRLMILLYLMQ
ncbi:MAG: Fic family protein, partial [Clostridiales bacterium]|nr:Fic family protein [Clostridiales bacterium]